MSDPTDHLATVRAALDVASKATPGPWHVIRHSEGTDDVPESDWTEWFDIDADRLVDVHDTETTAAVVALRNATDAIAALADECERLRAEAVTDASRIVSIGAEIDRTLGEHAGGRISALESAAARIATLEAEMAQAKAAPGATTAIKSVERIKSTSKALGYSADYMAAIERVLSCLRAVEENGGPLTSTADSAKAPRVATVGELLGSHPIVEWFTAPDWYQARIRQDGASMVRGADLRWRHEHAKNWSSWGQSWGDPWQHMGRPARLVPADQADADPASRGPIGEG